MDRKAAVNPGNLNRIERLLLESLRTGPIELSDRTIPAISAWLGCTSQVLSVTKNNFLRRGFVLEKADDADSGTAMLHLTPTGEEFLSRVTGGNGQSRGLWGWKQWWEYLLSRKS